VKRREEPRIRAESRGISGESAAPAVRRRPGGRIGWGKRRGGEEARREREVRRGRGGGVWLGGEGNRLNRKGQEGDAERDTPAQHQERETKGRLKFF